MLVKAQERRVQMNQKEAETSEASSCDPTIEASDLSTSFVSLENNMSSDRHRGRAAGVAMVQRMKRFDSTSNLSRDKNKTVEKLSWNDLEVGEMVPASASHHGGFLDNGVSTFTTVLPYEPVRSLCGSHFICVIAGSPSNRRFLSERLDIPWRQRAH